MKKRFFAIFLLVMFCGVFLMLGPSGVIGTKYGNQGLNTRFVQQKPDKVEQFPVIDERLPRETLENQESSMGKTPYRPNPQTLLPRLGEVGDYQGLRVETILDPEFGRPVTVAADWIVVVYKPELYEQHRDKAVYDKFSEINKKYGCEIIESSMFRGSFELVSIPKGETKTTLIQKMKNDPNVEDAMYDSLRLPMWAPNDPYYDGASQEQWYFQSYIAGNFVQGGACNLPGGWDLMGVGNYGGDPNIRIANLDTGSAYDDYSGYKKSPELKHMTNVRDISGIIASNTYSTPHILVATDINGNPSGGNTYPYPTDCQSHGTDTTHIHSSWGNNGAWIAGGAWNCSLIPVKVLPGTSSTVASGIDYARALGADVITMSLGGSSGIDGTACANAIAAGIFVVAATGNDYVTPISYPAGYINVVAVGMVESNGHIACPTNEPLLGGGSNYGMGSTAGFQGNEVLEIDVVAGGGSGDTYKQFYSYGFNEGQCPTLDSDFKLQPPSGYISYCLLYTSPSPRDRTRSRMPSSA